jgi:putative flippase GtrA
MTGSADGGTQQRAISSSALRRFARFIGVGGACFVGNLALLWVCTGLLGVQYQISLLISFVTTNLLGYVGNRVYAFRSTASHRLSEAARYYASALLSLAVCMAMMKMFVEWLHWHYMAANVLAGALLMLSNFALHSAWTFPARVRKLRGNSPANSRALS